MRGRLAKPNATGPCWGRAARGACFRCSSGAQTPRGVLFDGQPASHCPGLTSGSTAFSLADLGKVCLLEHLCGDLRFRFHQNKYCNGPPLPASRGYHKSKQTRRILRACPGSPEERVLTCQLPESSAQALGPLPLRSPACRCGTKI